MKKKMLDLSLHSTRGIRYKPKLGLSGRVVIGEGFSKKVNLRYKYTNFNLKGKTNIVEWL